MTTEATLLHEAKEDFSSASIDFIFADHSPENLPKIIDALVQSDGDIIAIEKIREGTFGMGTTAEKADLSRRMTEFLSSNTPITESAAEYFNTNEPLFTGLLDKLRESGKRIVILDMGTDDPGFSIYKRTVELREEYVRKLRERQQGGNITEEELKDLALDCKIAIAQSFEYREHVMENQLKEIAKNNPGQKITVMMGAAHTPVSHTMRSEFDTSRTFVPTDEDELLYPSGVKMRFENNLHVRMLRFNLNKLGLSVVDPDRSSKDDR